MEKHQTIPSGYLTVGELAKKMNTTVRTLQYYDREGLLSPSAKSEGGRRLYSDKDIVKLHQILSLKYLGFSLDDIKNRLVALDTPEQVASALTEQAGAVRKQIASLSEVLQTLEKLHAEILQIQTVDWKKYADIVVNLQIKNEYYWMIKHFDNETLDILSAHFEVGSAMEMAEGINRLLDTAAQYKKAGVDPESAEGQQFAKAFWDKMVEFSGGDMNMLAKVMQASETALDKEWAGKKFIKGFIEPALGFYFTSNDINPFEG
ncbi:MAG: MerR family transcriptional regulator [Actinomycetia bacterium]|nr:MerR family transcriptional regulator [Actinomycetes bacterium]